MLDRFLSEWGLRDFKADNASGAAATDLAVEFRAYEPPGASLWEQFAFEQASDPVFFKGDTKVNRLADEDVFDYDITDLRAQAMASTNSSGV